VKQLSVILVSLFLSSLPALAQAVEGTVFNTTTGASVSGAKVMLQQQGIGVYSTITDRYGNFRFDDIQNGTYTPQYSAVGYGIATGAPTNSSIEVKAGATVRLEGFLTPRSRISGRVLDGRGDPVNDARVDAVLSSDSIQLYTDVHTDGNGRFTMPLGPVRQNFTLVATPPAGWKPPAPNPDSKEPRAWARTFYPNAVFRELAAPIVVPPSGDLDGLEITLLAVPLHAIRGVLLNADGDPAPKTQIGLWDSRLTGEPAFATTSAAGGGFQLLHVPEGEWGLVSEIQTGGVTFRAAEWIEVKSRDIEGLKLHLSHPIAVSGRVIFETRPGMPTPEPPQFLLNERHAGQQVFAGTSRAARADQDGHFEFHELYPGAYSLSTGPAPPGYYLDSVRLGNVPAPVEMELSATSPELTVVYGSDGGTVRGTVENCHSSQVLLVPQDAPGMPLFTTISGSDCRFEIGSVRPGDYAAVATPTIRPWLDVLDPALLRTASRVTVRAGETTQADLRITILP